MATLTVCEDHPRRTRHLTTFTYVDADGITYVRHYCPECAEEEIEEGLYDWQSEPGGYRYEQARAKPLDNL